jgi:hypothetical protein
MIKELNSCCNRWRVAAGTSPAGQRPPMVPLAPHSVPETAMQAVKNDKIIEQLLSQVDSNCRYTVKVRLLESIFTRYMALFKVPWCLALETSLKRPRQDKCLS